MKRLFLLSLSLLALSLGQKSAEAQTDELYATLIQNYGSQAPIGATLSGTKLALANMGTTDINVTKLTVRLVGTATNGDISSATFYEVTDTGRSNLGTAGVNQDFAAILNGSPIITIPAGETRDIVVDYLVDPTTQSGHSFVLTINEGDIVYESTTPNNVTGEFPLESQLISVVDASYYFTVSPEFCGGLSVTLPHGVTRLYRGATYYSKIRTAAGPARWKVDLYQNGTFLKNLTSNVLEAPGTFTNVYWTLPSNLPVAGTGYRLRFTLVDAFGNAILTRDGAPFVTN